MSANNARFAKCNAHELALLRSRFDEKYYLRTYPDVGHARVDPLDHYLTAGAQEGRDPHPEFSTSDYLNLYEDVKSSGMNPFLHFIMHGEAEGRLGSRAKLTSRDTEVARLRAIIGGHFDRAFYLENNPDVASSGMDPFDHFVRHGAEEGRNPNKDFDIADYTRRNAMLLTSRMNPLEHFVLNPKKSASKPQSKPKVGWSADLLRHAVMRIARDRIGITVVVPIYNAPNEVARCIYSLLAHTPADAKILLIDDASPDPAVGDLLASLTGPGITIIRHDENIGYTRTINEGIRLAGRDDVVLLNSDTEVCAQWLVNLAIAAYSQPNIATSTALSNNAGAFSAPKAGEYNPRPENLSFDELARSVRSSSEHIYPVVPTGSGFCLYIRRACIDQIGLFDDVAFPKGYGEENDFCMRANRAGWSNLIDDATYIYHVRSASFGDSKTDLLRKGRQVVDERYPEYSSEIRVFSEGSDLKRVRANVDAAFKVQTPQKLKILFVTSTQTGGTPQTNKDLMFGLEGKCDAYHLSCDSKKIELEVVRDRNLMKLETIPLRDRLKPFPHESGEYDDYFRELVVRHSIELVHIRHIAWHSLSMPKICKELGIPVLFSFHDFYTVCPTVNLLDKDLVFCGGTCTQTQGDCAAILWPKQIDQAPIKNFLIHDWRGMMREMLLQCDDFVTTSDSARNQIQKSFPELSAINVIPHGRDLRMTVGVGSSDKVRILLPGNIGEAKGASLIQELCNHPDCEGLEFHVLGGAASKLKPQNNLVLHGRYSRDDFAEKALAINPTFGAIFSIWPETFCHTLTEMWSVGLPVLAFDLGAVGDRIRDHGGGWLMSEQNAAAVLRTVREIMNDHDAFLAKRNDVLRWQQSVGSRETVALMADRYWDIYRRLLDRRARGCGVTDVIR